MKKHIILCVIFALTAGALLAQEAARKPLGLTIRMDGLSFGNVMADGYKFAGSIPATAYSEGGYGSVLPKISFNHAFGRVSVLAMAATNFYFSKEITPSGKNARHYLTPIRFQGAYNLPLSRNNTLTFALSYRARIPWGGFFSDLSMKSDIMPWFRWMYNSKNLQLYAMFQLAFYWNDTQTPNQLQRTFKIGTGIDQTFTGNNQQNQGIFGFQLKKLGLYGYAAPTLVFYDSIAGNDTNPDLMPSMSLALGFKGRKIDLLTSITFPTGSNAKGNNMDAKGITIDPRVTWSVLGHFSVYLDLSFGHIGANKNKAPFALTPTVGAALSL